MRQSQGDIVLAEGNNELNVALTPIVMPIAGSIDPGRIWYEGLVGWKFIIPNIEIPLNEEIHLAPLWINKSEINIVGHVDLVVTYPDGTKAFLSAVLNQDKEAAPNSGYFVQFAPFISSQEGTYTLEATLSSAGQVLDSVTFTLVTVPVAAKFTYVSDITSTGCSINLYSAVGPWVDVKNVGSVAGECQLRLYVNEYIDFTYRGWRDTGLTLSAVLQPGEIKTFKFCVFLRRTYNFSYLARFVGDPGTIEGGRFAVRRYA